jgi:hypothetical protein
MQIEAGIDKLRFLTTTDDPIDLAGLGTRIRASSNFRFNWQFYSAEGFDLRSPVTLGEALNLIVTAPELHRFLRESFEELDDVKFEIDSLHEHCRVELTADFENILASAAADHLGAYSRDLRSATPQECAEVAELFRGAGEYVPFQLLPGRVSGCLVCSKFNNHLFSTWFDGVYWDWCLRATWPHRKLLWLGCLTDTD